MAKKIPKIVINGQKCHFTHCGPYKCHQTGHVGCLWMCTDEMEHIQKELAHLEHWVKNDSQKLWPKYGQTMS